jgi:hypothetical protein
MTSGMKFGYWLDYLRYVDNIDHYLAEFYEERDADVL